MLLRNRWCDSLLSEAKMHIEVSEEFRRICREIVAEGKSLSEWAETESDDMFQSPSFVGGYDADEEAFCFSFYDNERAEHWFQLTLDEIRRVDDGSLERIDLRPAE